MYAGRQFQLGQEVPASRDRCEECRCLQGLIECSRRRCPIVNCRNPGNDGCCDTCQGKLKILKCIDTPSCFSPFFTKEDDFYDFLFASLADVVLHKWCLLLTLKAPNKNCSRRHFIFLLFSLEENKA